MDDYEIATNHIRWFVQRLFDMNAWVTRVEVIDEPDMTPHEWVFKWMIWALSNHFLYILGDTEGPCAGIILRPIESDLFDRIQADYYSTLFEFDHSGDTTFVDAAYGRGHYPALMDIIRMQGMNNVAWEHDGRVRCVPIDKMPRVLAMMGR